MNGYNGRGLTPLHVAVKHAVMYKSCPASLKSIQTLLGFGADINKDDTDTVLPVQMALVGNCRKHKALLGMKPFEFNVVLPHYVRISLYLFYMCI